MKKEITFTEQNTSYNDLSRLFSDGCAWLQTPVMWLRRYYYAILEREVSMKQAFYITQAQVAFVFAAFPIMSSLLLHLAAVLCGLQRAFTCAREPKGIRTSWILA